MGQSSSQGVTNGHVDGDFIQIVLQDDETSNNLVSQSLMP